MTISAMFNQNHNHEQALYHIDQSIGILDTELQKLAAKISAQGASLSEDQRKSIVERTSLLAIAYYNKGCECEHLQLLPKAMKAFKLAVGLQNGPYGNA